MNYYNEWDHKTAAWLRELIKAGPIPRGEVDERSITDVQPRDLRGFTQCHFFAGIGGWSYALKLAGWPEDREVWTGSCPCQPLSCAGQRKGHADEQHLWPAFFNLIAECKPATIFGEQVAGKIGREWLSGVRADMESLGYAFGASGLCAYAVKAPSERLRAFWVADAAVNGRKGLQQCPAAQIQKDWTPQALDSWHGTGNPFQDWKKLLAGTCVRRMDDGVSSELVIRPALRGFGNAIVPQVASEFIQAYLETLI